MVIVVK